MKVKKSGNHLWLHNEQEVPLACPYSPPNIQMSKIEKRPVQLDRTCGSWCALFKYHDKGVVKLFCGIGREISVFEMKEKKK